MVLRHIRMPLEWRLDDDTFELVTEAEEFPEPLATRLLGKQPDGKTITGSWALAGGELVLTNIVAGEETGPPEVRLPLQTAGQVRVNLGDLQYNLLRPN